MQNDSRNSNRKRVKFRNKDLSSGAEFQLDHTFDTMDLRYFSRIESDFCKRAREFRPYSQLYIIGCDYSYRNNL